MSAATGRPLWRAVVAPDRASGEAVWRYAAEGREGGWGLAGSPAVGAGRLFVTGLEGRVGAVHQ